MQLGTDPQFENYWWYVQRISWIFIAITIILALLGAFGRGYLSQATINIPGSFSKIEFERFLRYQTPTMLKINLNFSANDNQETQIFVDKKYLECFNIEKITPEPKATIILPGGILYDFTLQESVADLNFQIASNKFGFCQGQFQIANQNIIIKHFIYP